MKNLKDKIINIILVLILVIGVLILSYPYVSSYINGLLQSRIIDNYSKSVETFDGQKYSKFFTEADNYNKFIAQNYPSIAYANLKEQKQNTYKSFSKLLGTNILGVVNIPSIDVRLPVYFGSEEEELNKGVGHFIGSSLPIGGKSTHSALMTHTGLPSADLFNDIDKLKEGDKFFIYVLNRKLAYQVDKISVVLPTEIDDLSIIQNEDLVSLITCTPYSINTHRLIVRGHRVEYDENSDGSLISINKDNYKKKFVLICIISICLLLTLIVCYVLIKKRKKGERNAEK